MQLFVGTKWRTMEKVKDMKFRFSKDGLPNVDDMRNYIETIEALDKYISGGYTPCEDILRFGLLLMLVDVGLALDDPDKERSVWAEFSYFNKGGDKVIEDRVNKKNRHVFEDVMFNQRGATMIMLIFAKCYVEYGRVAQIRNNRGDDHLHPYYHYPIDIVDHINYTIRENGLGYNSKWAKKIDSFKYFDEDDKRGYKKLVKEVLDYIISLEGRGILLRTWFSNGYRINI